MTQDKLQKIILPIRGMHCRSCELLLEEKFSEVKYVEKSTVDHRHGVAEIYYASQKPDHQALVAAVAAGGYEVGEAAKVGFFSTNWQDYKELLGAAGWVVVAYVILKILGITNLVNITTDVGKAGLGMAVLIGLVAGFSSCMALIGGLVLGLSAKHAEKHPEATILQKFRPHLYFNFGRIFGYALLGGLLGLLGSFFQLSIATTSILTLFAGTLMLFVGLQLINIFPMLSSWKITLPKSLANFFGTNRHHAEYNHLNSMIVGALTFFLPCGFTQAMQVYAVSTGSFTQGALAMGLFALGTAPGLLSIGGLTAALKGSAARKFFKVAGVVVIAFAFFNLSNAWALSGINFNTIFKEKESVSTSQDPNVQLIDGVQVVRMVENSSGYSPNKFTIKKGIPVKWIIDAKAPYSCAASIIVPKMGIQKNLTAGENIIKFTPTAIGRLPFSCGMGMYTGVFNVVDKDGDISTSSADLVTPAAASGTTCGISGGGCGGCGGGRTFTSTVAPQSSISKNTEEVQKIQSTFLRDTDIQPNTFAVKAGLPVEYTIDVKESAVGCMYAIVVSGLYDQVVPLEAGKKIVMNFTPQETGKYYITCAMGVVRGLINVK